MRHGVHLLPTCGHETRAYHCPDPPTPCRKAYADGDGNEVACRRQIMASYAQSRLLLDVLAAVPFHYVDLFYASSSSSDSAIIRLIRLMRHDPRPSRAGPHATSVHVTAYVYA